MKNLIVALLLVLPLLCSAQAEELTSMFYDWDELDKSQQELIGGAAHAYLAQLANNEIEGFYQSCHSKFRESTSFEAFKEMGEIFAEAIADIESVEFLDAKRVAHSAIPQSPTFATGGSLDHSDPNYLQFYTLAGMKEQAIALYKIERKPLSSSITLKLALENEEYKLTAFHLATSAMDGKDAEYYLQLAKKWEDKRSNFPQFITLMMAHRLSYRGNGTLNDVSIRTMERLQAVQMDTALVTEITKWKLDASTYEIIKVDFAETKSDITTNILYLSKVKLGKNSTRKEAEVLFKHFKERYPDLVKEFGRFLFTAYEEYPSLPSKQYRNFKVLIEDE